jgi:hypothetical protein
VMVGAIQRLPDELTINRECLVLNKTLLIIHKSHFGEAAAKSDYARSGFVHAVGKAFTGASVPQSFSGESMIWRTIDTGSLPNAISKKCASRCQTCLVL